MSTCGSVEEVSLAHSKTAFRWSWLKNGGMVRTTSFRGMSETGRKAFGGRGIRVLQHTVFT